MDQVLTVICVSPTVPIPGWLLVLLLVAWVAIVGIKVVQAWRRRK